MADLLFTPKDIPNNALNNFTINNYDEKVKIIRDWQEGIANGRILTSKEEQLQWSFLEGFFGKVLEYPFGKHLTDYQLENEQKAEFDATKPDGSLGYFELKGNETHADVRAVIELKGATINLDKKQNRKDFAGSPVEQAFNYVPKMGGKCQWVIVSNFIEIRLYHHSDITRYESFPILDLLKNGNLKKFCFILESGRLFLKNGESRIEAIFAERQERQKTISVEFYNEYKQIREILYYDIKKRNEEIDPILLFHTTQKLIDRIIFICFVQDMQIIGDVLNNVRKAPDISFHKDDDLVWQSMKSLFIALNEGYAKKNIPPFNGGLFREDGIIDNLKMTDFRITDLIKFAQKYDFQSDVDVNILGHIFEQSISDIEEILFRIQNENTLEMAQTGMEEIKKPTTNKRKKDGIYYTPAYITRYIVEQSVGAWLNDRSHEILEKMGIETIPVIEEEDFADIDKDDKRRRTYAAKINGCLNYWNEYENALRRIKVLDPACGSGAFLVQVFDYLYAQWKITEREKDTLNGLLKALEKKGVKNKKAKDILLDGAFGNDTAEWQVKRQIIEENIYGVDINAASVEITKLSLWLKTANREIKLAGLDDNIQHGNSLIDDAEVAGDLAFDWQARFKKIMNAGGFDVVVGNPPYIPTELLSSDYKEYIKLKFPQLDRKYDTSTVFILQSFNIAKNQGKIGFISSITWQTGENYNKLREFILLNKGLIKIVNLPFDIFPDAYIDTGIYIFSTSKTQSYYIYNYDKHDIIESINYLPFQKIDIQNAIDNNFKIILSSQISSIFSRTKNKGFIRLGDISISTQGLAANLFKVKKQSEKNAFPFMLKGQVNRYKLQIGEFGYVNLDNNKTLEKFYQAVPKILIRRIISRQDRLLATFTEEIFLFTKDVNPFIIIDSKFDTKYLLTLLNSKLFSHLYVNSSTIATKDDFRQTTLKEIRNLPILKLAKKAQQPFIAKADMMLAGNKKLQEQSGKFLEMLGADMKIEKFSQKLNHWYELDWAGFKAEIKKAKPRIGLTGKIEEGWHERFHRLKTEVLQLTQSLQETDKEIDKMVYALYGLTEEEIRVVENEK